jgi:hypothetical protein
MLSYKILMLGLVDRLDSLGIWWHKFKDTTTILKMTKLIMTILTTLYTGEVTYN